MWVHFTWGVLAGYVLSYAVFWCVKINWYPAIVLKGMARRIDVELRKRANRAAKADK